MKSLFIAIMFILSSASFASNKDSERDFMIKMSEYLCFDEYIVFNPYGCLDDHIRCMDLYISQKWDLTKNYSDAFVNCATHLSPRYRGINEYL